MNHPTDFKAFRSRGLTQLNALAGHLRAQLLPRLRPTDPLPVAVLLRMLSERNVVVEGTELRIRAYCAPHLPSDLVWAATRISSTGRLLLAFCRVGWSELQTGEGRTRFSALHELAHALLHHQELAAYGLIPHAPAGATTPEGDWCLERQANRLAGALLMPAEPLRKLEQRGKLNVEELVRRYQVTPMAAKKRIAEVQKDLQHRAPPTVGW